MAQVAGCFVRLTGRGVQVTDLNILPPSLCEELLGNAMTEKAVPRFYAGDLREGSTPWALDELQDRRL